MKNCPNCAAPLVTNASTCERCSAKLSDDAAWSPVPAPSYTRAPITARTYFRTAFLAPYLIPLALYLFNARALATFLAAGAFIGGLAYVIFALVMCLVIGRLGSLAAIRSLWWAAPPLFVLFHTATWLVLWPGYVFWELPRHSILALIVVFPFYLTVGYAYVILIMMGYGLLSRMGWVGGPWDEYRPNHSLRTDTGQQARARRS
jgi:hypothetical protein